MTTISKTNKILTNQSIILLVSDVKKLSHPELSKEEIKHVQQRVEENDKSVVSFNRLNKWIWIQIIKKKEDVNETIEKCRTAGNSILCKINDNKYTEVVLVDLQNNPTETLAFAEGMILGNYQFMKYKTGDNKKKAHTLKKILLSSFVAQSAIDELLVLTDAVCKARDLINEPVCSLNATQLAESFKSMVKGLPVKVTIFNKQQITAMKMGGLLAVNKGSIDPPTFTVLEYKPAKCVNKKPYVLVGKGIVYDTGGLNLKPGSFMDDMKSDMSGSAAVACAIYAIAKNKLPIHVIALAPSTDNRPGGNAYAADDVITMHDGTTVEVKNTDAEGRLILADALSYAKKLKPELTFSIATLTGAASRAIGKYASVAMQAKAEKEMDALKASGYRVHERIAEFPFWDDYAELIKSSIADIKNIGGVDAGAITAGKFLEHFTDYPYIHIDIAGTAFLDSKDSYRNSGATGVGVRLFYDFLKSKTKK